jgi:hypothetical protein
MATTDERSVHVETATQERTSRTFEPSAMPAGDATAVSLGVAQRVIGTLTELSIVAAKEHARLAAELQIAALEVLRESQSVAMRWPPAWPDGLTDPFRLYHRGLTETLDSAQRALTFMGASARLVVQAADRLQTAAADAGRHVREELAGSPATRQTPRG